MLAFGLEDHSDCKLLYGREDLGCGEVNLYFRKNYGHVPSPWQWLAAVLFSGVGVRLLGWGGLCVSLSGVIVNMCAEAVCAYPSRCTATCTAGGPPSNSLLRWRNWGLCMPALSLQRLSGRTTCTRHVVWVASLGPLNTHQWKRQSPASVLAPSAPRPPALPPLEGGPGVP